MVRTEMETSIHEEKVIKFFKTSAPISDLLKHCLKDNACTVKKKFIENKGLYSILKLEISHINSYLQKFGARQYNNSNTFIQQNYP